MLSPLHESATSGGPLLHRPRVPVTDLLLLLMAIIWGVNLSVVKFGTTLLDPLAYNGVRVALAAVALLAVAAFTGGPRPSPRDVLLLLLLGVIGNGLYQILFIEGIARTRAGNAGLLLAATPVFIALIGRTLGIERIGPRGYAGIVASVAGISLVIFGKPATGLAAPSMAGDLLVLLGSLCWSAFTVMLKPYAARVNPVRVAALTMLGGAIPLALVSLPAILDTSWQRLPAAAWWAIAYSGIGALVIAYLLWYRGIRVLGPTRTAMYGNLQPVIALIVAWLWLREVPTLWQGVGTAGILGGLLLTRS